jgi:hypothetical protein|tara:strand:- start:29 stop:178 length:150 start_codon:yes stop_codon:yes gene_type:complete
MNEELLRLLEDCKDSFEWIIQSEYWDYIKHNSSADILVSEINKIINKEK